MPPRKSTRARKGAKVTATPTTPSSSSSAALEGAQVTPAGRHPDYSLLARGNRSGKTKSTPANKIDSAVSAKDNVKIAEEEKSKKKASKVPKESKTSYDEDSDYDVGESLGESDSTTSSSEDEATTSDDEFIASEPEETTRSTKKPKNASPKEAATKTAKKSALKSGKKAISEQKAKNDSEATPSKKESKKKAKKPIVVQDLISSSSSSSSDDSSSEDEELAAPRKRTTKSIATKPTPPKRVRKEKTKPSKKAKQATLKDDSSDEDDDDAEVQEVVVTPPSTAKSTKGASTKTAAESRAATAAAAAAASPKKPVLDHGYNDPKVLNERSVVMVPLGKNAFRMLTTNIFVPDEGSHFAVKNTSAASLVSGSFYFSAFDRNSNLRNFTRIKVPRDIKLPCVNADWLVPPSSLFEIACGIAMAGMVMTVDAAIERPNRYGGSALMREVTMLSRDLTDPESFHTILLTLWGEVTAVEYDVNDVILVMNAKQSSFQGSVRFTVGDSSAISVVTKAKTAKKFCKHAKAFLKKQAGACVELPNAYEIWED